MDFKLRKPCTACPWRSDRHPFFGISKNGYARTLELTESLQGNHVFPCHKTATWEDTDDGDIKQVQNEKTQACAGALITMEKSDHPGNLLRIAERLGLYDRNTLDMTQPTYGSLEEWAETHNPENTP